LHTHGDLIETRIAVPIVLKVREAEGKGYWQTDNWHEGFS